MIEVMQMKTITTGTTEQYNIYIGKDLLFSLAEKTNMIARTKRVVILTDDIVHKLYFDVVYSSLSCEGYEVLKYVIENGENSKDSENYISILNFLAENKISRDDTLISLGGGVVGDLGGFVSATYLRGIRYANVPTTLLSAVDSSIGGKTAINLESGKNLVGAFYPPSLVVCDLTTFKTLPEDVFREGTAEVIKYGAIMDRDFFNTLSNKMGDNSHFSLYDKLEGSLEDIVCRCVEHKLNIVSQDEFDRGNRKLLNFGHTIAHTLEKLSNYDISHGYAVAKGMAFMAYFSFKFGACSKQCFYSLFELLSAYGFNLDIKFNHNDIFNILISDKKVSADKIDLILLKDIGDAFIYPVSIVKLKTMLCEILEDYNNESFS